MPDTPNTPADLAGWLSYLEQLHPKAIALGLERVSQVKQRLALDINFLLITVGGTNGKGSTCAMLERILTTAGYRVGCYTSPHLLRYNERVRVLCQEVSDAGLCTAFAAVEQARGDTPLTYFEFGTLAAVWHFSRQQVQVAILEVGLGGRLDAVNVFDPDCAIVTSVDIDHIDFLGNSRESIAFEKAGIFRTGKPALCGDADAPEALLHHAQNIGAELQCIGKDFGFEHKSHQETWQFWSGAARIENLPLPVLSGEFQLANAACALQAIQLLKSRLQVDIEDMRAGLLGVALQGRFQKISREGSGQPDVILDVAHNPHAARGLADNLRRSAYKQGKTIAVFAMLSDKDIAGVLRAVGHEVDEWHVAGIPQPRGLAHDKLAGLVREVLPQAQVSTAVTVEQAFAQACRSAGENDRIVAFGSFYTVADVLRALI
jgi:dihydrofolate synthase/folylpolyglutamate synthase